MTDSPGETAGNSPTWPGSGPEQMDQDPPTARSAAPSPSKSPMAPSRPTHWPGALPRTVTAAEETEPPPLNGPVSA